VDLPIVAITTVQLASLAQDAHSLEAQLAKLIAALAVQQPTWQIQGSDVGGMGGGATWLCTVSVDGSGAPPPVPQVEVPLTRALMLFQEFTDFSGETLAYSSLLTRAILATPPGSTCFLVQTRITGAGQGGKWLLAMLFDRIPNTPPPPPIAPTPEELDNAAIVLASAGLTEAVALAAASATPDAEATPRRAARRRTR